MVRPRLRASLKWEPFFLRCLMSSEPFKDSLRSLWARVRLDEKSLIKGTLRENIASVYATLHFGQVNIFEHEHHFLCASLEDKSKSNLHFKDTCLIFVSKWDCNLTMKRHTDKKKPRETKLHLLVNHTQHQQIAAFRTYRPSCCCGSPCHVCRWCPWMKRGRGPFRLSHSLWAQCLRGTRRPHLKEGRK